MPAHEGPDTRPPGVPDAEDTEQTAEDSGAGKKMVVEVSIGPYSRAMAIDLEKDTFEEVAGRAEGLLNEELHQRVREWLEYRRLRPPEASSGPGLTLENRIVGSGFTVGEGNVVSAAHSLGEESFLRSEAAIRFRGAQLLPSQPGGNPPADPQADVPVEMDDAYYDEVRKAVGRGTRSSLFGTSTKSLERHLRELRGSRGGPSAYP